VRYTHVSNSVLFCLVLIPGVWISAAWGAPYRLGPDNSPGFDDAVTTINTGGETLGIAAAPRTLFLISGGDLQVVDISKPTAPVTVATVVTPGHAQDVEVQQHYAYVADDNKGLQIVDISRPNVPRIVGHADVPGAALNVSVSGHYVYVTNGYALRVIDVAIPSAAAVVGVVATAGQALGVAIAWPYAYVAAGSAGLQIINISNPAAPFITATIDTPDEAQNVAVAGRYAYVADSVSLQIIDITDPARPAVIGGFHEPAYGVAVMGHHVYMAAGWGLQVIDVANPALPKPLLRAQTFGFARRVTVIGGIACVSNGEFLTLIDAADPAPGRSAMAVNHSH
jgi:hypothetical protein